MNVIVYIPEKYSYITNNKTKNYDVYLFGFLIVYAIKQ